MARVPYHLPFLQFCCLLSFFSFDNALLHSGNGRWLTGIIAKGSAYHVDTLKCIPSNIIPDSILYTEAEDSYKHLSSILHDLRDFRSDDLQASESLVSITQHVLKYTGSFTADEVSKSLYGLRRMTSDCPEVLSLLSALTPIIVNCKEEFNAIQIGMSNYGIQGLRMHTEAAPLVDFIYNQVDLLVIKTSKFSSLSDSAIQLLVSVQIIKKEPLDFHWSFPESHKVIY